MPAAFALEMSLLLLGAWAWGRPVSSVGLLRCSARRVEFPAQHFPLSMNMAETPLYHFDMYRVTSLDDLYSTGFFDYLGTDAILVIEWSENIVDALPDNTIWVRFERLGDCERKIIIEGDERF